MNSKEKGDKGEILAIEDYESQGYILLQKNYRCSYGEIDAILQKDSMIVFLEVKVVDFSGLESLAELVGVQKQKRIRESANAFLLEKNLLNRDFRFDVAAVLSDTKKVMRFENAFTE